MGPGNDCPAHLVRYCSGASISKLAAMFQLPAAMQDWEVIVADPARVDESLSAYDDSTLDENDRFTLMQLVIASLDDGRQAGQDVEPSWQRAEALLRRDSSLHATALSYWACGDDPDPDHHLPMTPEIQLPGSVQRPGSAKADSRFAHGEARAQHRGAHGGRSAPSSPSAPQVVDL
jgi:hypothetical protein